MNDPRKYISVLVFTLIAFISASQPAFSFEWPSYEIEATLDTHAKNITAKETVTFTNNTSKSLEEIYFHIYPNRHFTQEEKSFILRYAGYFKVNPYSEGFPSKQIDIRSITLDSKRLSFQTEGEDDTLLAVALPEELGPGEKISIVLDFSIDIPHAYGRFGWNENIFALSRWYPILSVVDDKGWNKHPFYPYHRPFFSESANYKVTMTMPKNLVAIHTGELISEEIISEETKTLHIETSSPAREFTMALSPDYKSVEESFEGIKIKSFYLGKDDARAREAANIAKDVFSYYTKHFGAYSYPEFSIAPVYLGYGGEQMSNLIFIDTRVFDLPKFLSRYFDFLISHETGHQWFYNIVGVDGFTEMWLEEGVNSYFNLEYLENKYGKDATVIELPRSLEWLLPNFSFRRGRDYRYKLLARTKHDQAVVGRLSDFTEPSGIFSITYGKGSQVISMLRSLIGDEAFSRVYARVFKDYRFRNLSDDDFIRICEEESHQPLKDFFLRWLTTTQKYDAAVKRVSGNQVVVENRGTLPMPTEVEIKTKDGQTQKILWDGKSREETLTISAASPITKVRLDPQEKILDIDRSNNAWPPTIHLRPVPLYIGLYDVPLFLPEDGYNLIVGPEIANGGFGVKTSFQKPSDYNFYSATDYDFGDQLQNSRLGFQLNNVGRSFRTAGFEVFNVTDYDNGEDDLAGAKAYVRQELWPASYGLSDINDHITFYLLRNRSLNQGFTASGREDSRNTSYLKKDEAILGTNLHLGRSGPYPDPIDGYNLDWLLESSGHFLEATQFFYRSSLDWAGYKTVTHRSRLALRLKGGWGFPLDKSLYELGGMDGLRGFDRKTVRGARMGLGSLEYRFPIYDKLNIHLFDNVIGFEALGGVVFADAGQAWNEVYKDSQLQKDAGIGLRATMNVGSFLEKVILRFDIAQPIAEEDNDSTHFWFGAGHAF